MQVVKLGFLGSLRGRLVLLFLLVTVMPMMVLAAVGMSGFTTTLIEKIHTNYEVKAFKISDGIKALVENGQKIVETAAAAPSTREGTKKTFEDYDKGIVEIDDHGLGTYLKQIQENSQGQFYQILLTDMHGQILASSDGSEGSLQDIEWWQKAAHEGRYMGGAQVDSLTGVQYLPMAAAVKDNDDTTLGVLIGKLDTEIFSEIIHENISEMGDVGVVLVDDGGEVLVNTSASYGETLQKSLLNDTNASSEGNLSETGNIERATTSKGEEEGGLWTVSLRSEGIDNVDAFKWSLALGVPMGDVLAPISNMKQLVFTIMAAFAALVAVLSYVLIGRISRPISLLAQDAVRVSQGDLSLGSTMKASGIREVNILYRSFSQMVENIKNLVARAGDAAEKVADSTDELNASAVENTRGAEEVAATVQEISSNADKQKSYVNGVLDSVGRQSRLIEQLSGNSMEVFQSSSNTRTRADEGNRALADAVRQMHLIRGVVEDSVSKVNELGEHSEEIGIIVNTITDIAKQTNLLALNATIEAARAGEHGKGFAVVAEEVGSLAAESSQSADEIGILIKDIQMETAGVVDSIESVTQEVQKGMKMMADVGRAFRGIRKSIREISQQAQTSAEAAEELDQGSSEITGAMEGVADFANDVASSTETVAAVTQEQTASMEEIAASVQALSRLASDLRESLSRFE
ncbi:MAG: hypothetical protein GX318_02270 [Clostridia bacterium]|nr:hypothetical protein [Clostridia bacterium]